MELDVEVYASFKSICEFNCLWLPNVNRTLKDEILLGALLQESGKFILSEIVLNRFLKEEFIKKIEAGTSVVEVEEFLGVTVKNNSGNFKYWKLSDNLIKMIEVCR